MVKTGTSAALDIPAPWRVPLAALGLLLLSILGLYWHTVWIMASIWAQSDTYSHGFAVPLISLWLIWRVRHALAPLRPQPAGLAGLLMLGAAGLWLAGDLGGVNVVSQLALVMLLVLAVPAVLGWHVARVMTFALAFLFFAVPMGDFMLPQLMDWTADFTVLALRWSGIPVYREGLQFVIPSGSWSVIEACSGIRYLIASVTVGCLFAYLSYRSLRKRLIFVGVAILVPLVANWLRAYMIVLLGHLSGNELATGVDHILYGWVFFGVVILLMLLIGARWIDPPLPAPTVTADASPDASPTPNQRRWTAQAALFVLFIVTTPHLLERALALSVRSTPVQLAVLAPQAPWQRAEAAPSDWLPAFSHVVASAHTGYVNPQGQAVGVHLSYYRQQDKRRKLVSSENALVLSTDPNWSGVTAASATTALAGQPLQVSTLSLRQLGSTLSSRSAKRLQVWKFYWVDDRFTSSGVRAKIYTALGLLLGRGDDGAIVVLYTTLDPRLPEADGRAAANAVLHQFLQAQGAGLQAALRQTRAAD
ncbi:exosortase A [Hydrogenophaga sp.]|uniref:exosortase A n=1 Tax=Hydrogenophaga sp. TaxID=1904254 RepID=UPI0019C62518|nr:exosortase A [Hydrogenophaga sp.]MBD3893575.1 exosortase A [Hydrogenophaga sp.]